MASAAGGDEQSVLSPDAAFKALGNETRMEILQTLGRADDPLSFSQLRNRVGIRRGGRFNYHLGKLVGHFIEKSEQGYDITQAGRKVIQAVLSGAVTEAPESGLTEIDEACQLCSAPIEVRYRDHRMEAFCTECAGIWGDEKYDSIEQTDGYLGQRQLPPAGLVDRSWNEAYRAAWVWHMLKIYALANELCPACSAHLDMGFSVCSDHEPGDGRCEHCDRRYAAIFRASCRNCIFEVSGTAPTYFAATNTELLNLLTESGLNPISPDSIAEVHHVYSDYGEEIISADPFEGRFTFTVADEAITFTVDDTLSITDVTRAH